MHPAVGLLIAYVIGSIPAAYIAGRAVKGIDLREHGSGNLGATNVYRLLGANVAVAVLLFDALKGALPVRVLPLLLLPAAASADTRLLWAIAYGVAAIAGHVRPVFLLWKGGGKGVATAAGVFAALAPGPFVAALVVFAAVLAASGYVSLASLTAAAVLPLAVAAMRGLASPLFIVSLVVGAFVFWTHRANIGRLRRGEESRFGRRGAAAAAARGTATPPTTTGGTE